MIFNKVKSIIIEILEDNNEKVPQEINLNSKLRDLGLSSFDLATLTVMIEDEYEVDIFEDEIIDTVEQIVNKIEEK